MDTLTILNVIMAVVNLSVAIFQGWKEWHDRQQPRPHPLEIVVRDIAAAIRERP